jgi:hypothetical protein
VAVALYREGRISLGKAKELADLKNKWEKGKGERGKVEIRYKFSGVALL